MMGIAAARAWASRAPGEGTALSNCLISAARLAVFEHERAEAAEARLLEMRSRIDEMLSEREPSLHDFTGACHDCGRTDHEDPDDAPS